MPKLNRSYYHRIQPDIASTRLQTKFEHTYQANMERVGDRRRVEPKPNLSTLDGERE